MATGASCSHGGWQEYKTEGEHTQCLVESLLSTGMLLCAPHSIGVPSGQAQSQGDKKVYSILGHGQGT